MLHMLQPYQKDLVTTGLEYRPVVPVVFEPNGFNACSTNLLGADNKNKAHCAGSKKPGAMMAQSPASSNKWYSKLLVALACSGTVQRSKSQLNRMVSVLSYVAGIASTQQKKLSLHCHTSDAVLCLAGMSNTARSSAPVPPLSACTQCTYLVLAVIVRKRLCCIVEQLQIRS